jgi:CHAT domain-containing protein
VRAEDEAGAVHRLLGVTDTTLLLGSNATHGAVRASLPVVSGVHFACHAFTHPEDPSLSYLALADRPLYVSELADVDIPNAYLAYLSACTTAVGSTRLLDENMHIASAFQLVGYPHVIAALWPIIDRHAMVLACDVHEAIGNGLSPALALHQSIRSYRDQGRQHQTYIWAAYIHFGP